MSWLLLADRVGTLPGSEIRAAMRVRTEKRAKGIMNRPRRQR
jgi:hypothetical protein